MSQQQVLQLLLEIRGVEVWYRRVCRRSQSPAELNLTKIFTTFVHCYSFPSRIRLVTTMVIKLISILIDEQELWNCACHPRYLIFFNTLIETTGKLDFKNILTLTKHHPSYLPNENIRTIESIIFVCS